MGTPLVAATRASRRTPYVCAAAAVAIGTAVVVVGWGFGFPESRSVVPGTVAMKPATATMLVLSGIALALIAGRPTKRRRVVAGGLSLFCIALSTAFLCEYWFGISLGIDELPFRDVPGRANGIDHPGRVAPTSAGAILLLSFALLAIDSRRRRLTEILIAPVAILGATCQIGYVYSIPAFYGADSPAQMAINTGTLLLLLSVGTILARPRGRLHALLTSPTPGAVIVRRLLPFAVVMPLLLGWLRLLGQDAGVFGDRAGTWWLTAGTISCLVFVIARAARSVDCTVRESDHLKEEFVSVVTHELRTPLTSVAGYLDILLEDDDEDDQPPFSPHQQRCVEVARRNAQRLIDLVEDLLLVRRLEAGGERLTPERLDLSALLIERLESIAPVAGSKHVGIADDVGGGIQVEADPRRLAQIIDNLLSNAVKYTPDGGHVTVSLVNGGPSVSLKVTDTGIGIPACDHAHLFDPFFRASNASAGSGQGTGLGLVVTRRLVEAHGGTLGFESVEGEGATFAVTLPAPGPTPVVS
jgi:signal transduction histidine kinase